MRLRLCCVFLVLLVHLAVLMSCREDRIVSEQGKSAEQRALDTYIQRNPETSVNLVQLMPRDDISHLLEHLSATKVPISAFEVAKKSPQGIEVSSSLPWAVQRHEFVIVRADKAFLLGGGSRSLKELNDLLRSLSSRTAENEDKVQLSKMCWLMTRGFELNTYSGEQELRTLLVKLFEFKGLNTRESARAADNWVRDIDRLGFSHPRIEHQGTDTVVSLFDVAGLLATEGYEGPYLSRVDVRIESNGTCEPQEPIKVYPR